MKSYIVPLFLALVFTNSVCHAAQQKVSSSRRHLMQGQMMGGMQPGFQQPGMQPGMQQPGVVPGYASMATMQGGSLLPEQQQAAPQLLDIPVGMQLHHESPQDQADMDPLFHPGVVIFMIVGGLALGFGLYKYRKMQQEQEALAESLTPKDTDTPMERIKKLKKKLEVASNNTKD